MIDVRILFPYWSLESGTSIVQHFVREGRKSYTTKIKALNEINSVSHALREIEEIGHVLLRCLRQNSVTQVQDMCLAISAFFHNIFNSFFYRFLATQESHRIDIALDDQRVNFLRNKMMQEDEGEKSKREL